MESAKEYGLARAVLDSNAFLPLTDQEANAIADAKRFVIDVTLFEELIDDVVGNFIELEKTLNDVAIDYMIRAVKSDLCCKFVDGMRMTRLMPCAV